MYSFRTFIFPMNKELRYSLQYMKGVGVYKSFLFCSRLGISFPCSISSINFYYFTLLTFFFKTMMISVDKYKRIMSRR